MQTLAYVRCYVIMYLYIWVRAYMCMCENLYGCLHITYGVFSKYIDIYVRIHLCVYVECDVVCT